MKQLNVDVSPPAFLWDPYTLIQPRPIGHLTLTHVTFDLDPIELYFQVTCQKH